MRARPANRQPHPQATRPKRRKPTLVAVFLAAATLAAGADDPLSPVYSALTLQDAESQLGTVEQSLTENQAIDGYRHVAAIAELSGRLQSALEYYGKAGALGHEESEFQAAAILYELGRIAEAEERARRLVFGAGDYSVRRRATGVVARCMAADGRTAEALSLLSTVAAIDETEHLEPETLLLLLRLAEDEGRGDLAERTRRRLGELFPGSIELALAAADPTSITLAPSLPELLERPLEPPAQQVGGREGDTRARPDAGPLPSAGRVEESTPIGVQIGSFRDLENAEYMARDLRQRGFTVEILSSRRNDAELHRVVVPTVTGQDPQRLLMELKSNGVEGFLLF